MRVIRGMQQYFATIPPMFLDGLLYVLLALFAAVTISLNSDDAVKLIQPMILWWLKQVVAWLSAAFLAIKMFRSTSFADHQQAKEDVANGNPVVVKPIN